jgi:hypothetical protein
MRAGRARILLIAGAALAGCSSSGGPGNATGTGGTGGTGSGGAGGQVMTPPFPVDCLAPDGTYDVTDSANQPIQIVIANGRLASIAGHPCGDPWSGPDIPEVKGPYDNSCSLINEWCATEYQCDTAGLCFHTLSIVQQGSGQVAHWELKGASNTGCVMHSQPWNLGPAACQPVCGNIGACDGCGGNSCPTAPTRRPLGYPCTTASDCDVGLTCAGPLGVTSKECSKPCTTHADCTGLHDANGTPYRSCHNCTYSVGSHTYTAGNICVRTLVCGATSGGGAACAACLDACRNLPSCCTGVGCICESDCG